MCDICEKNVGYFERHGKFPTKMCSMTGNRADVPREMVKCNLLPAGTVMSYLITVLQGIYFNNKSTNRRKYHMIISTSLYTSFRLRHIDTIFQYFQMGCKLNVWSFGRPLYLS